MSVWGTCKCLSVRMSENLMYWRGACGYRIECTHICGEKQVHYTDKKTTSTKKNVVKITSTHSNLRHLPIQLCTSTIVTCTNKENSQKIFKIELSMLFRCGERRRKHGHTHRLQAHARRMSQTHKQAQALQVSDAHTHTKSTPSRAQNRTHASLTIAESIIIASIDKRHTL